MSGPDLLLAVDGGGTKTRALITDLEGHVLGRGLGPSSNLHGIGFEEVGRAVTSAVEDALQHALGTASSAAGPLWRTGRIAGACFGMSGVDSREDEAQISRWVREQAIAPIFLVVNDAELILAAGAPEGWGVALISGTGSVCLARSSDGREARVGGWGPLIGDEGSGYDVAIRALHLAARTADGRDEAPALLEAALRYFSLPHAHALIRHVHAPERTPGEIAGLAPAVADLAAKGDGPAQRVLAEAARELARMVEAVARRLSLSRPPLALAGGMLRDEGLRQALVSALGAEVGAVTYVEEPALGAVALARRLLNAAPRPK